MKRGGGLPHQDPELVVEIADSPIDLVSWTRRYVRTVLQLEGYRPASPARPSTDEAPAA